MFIIREMDHEIQFPIELLFKLNLNDLIADFLKKLLANKVVLHVGLCMALHDITNYGEFYFLPGDGTAHTRVSFRYLVFRPIMNEILTGKIKSCSKEGVQVTLGFFDDIFIQPTALQHLSNFNEAEQVWVWSYIDRNGSKRAVFMNPGKKIKFRVTAEYFFVGRPENSQEIDKPFFCKVPYSVTGTINEPGLGLLPWCDKQNNH